VEDDDNSEEALAGNMEGTGNNLFRDSGGMSCVDCRGESRGHSDFLLPATSGSWPGEFIDEEWMVTSKWWVYMGCGWRLFCYFFFLSLFLSFFFFPIPSFSSQVSSLFSLSLSTRVEWHGLARGSAGC
jgi:hypothetical protein